MRKLQVRVAVAVLLAATVLSADLLAQTARMITTVGVSYVRRVSGTLAMESATLSSLTSGRVVIAGTSGLLEDDAGLTYNKATDALSVTGPVTLGGDVILSRAAANVALLQNGANAQTLRLGPSGLEVETTGTALGVLQLRTVGNRAIQFLPNGTLKLEIQSNGNMDGSAGTTISYPNYKLTNVFASSTAPTIASGGCTSPAVTWNNGTAAFLVTIGTSCTGVKTFTLTLPAATNLWRCGGTNNTSDAAQQTNIIVARATSTTAVVVTSYDRVTGLQEDFTASDTYLMSCIGG